MPFPHFVSRKKYVIYFVDFSSGSASGVNASFEPGDANNDDGVDATDFELFVGNYNTVGAP